MKGNYDDIINLPHHVSPTRPRMSMIDRAAQFSPFSALTGHDSAVKETARLTDQRIELSEDMKSELNDRLLFIAERKKEKTEIEITYFKPDEKKDGVDRVFKMQHLQCEWVRISMELYRRNKWFSSGIIYWMFNDCWPAAVSWSIIDYYGKPKPAYYAFKRGAKPVIAAIDEKNGKRSVYVCNDSLKSVSGKGEIYLLNTKSNQIIWSQPFEFSVRENISEKVLEFDSRDILKLETKETILICDINGDFGSDRAFFVSSSYRNKDFGNGKLIILEQTAEYITVTADGYVHIAVLDVPYILEDNCFPLLKDEVRKIKIINR